MTECKKAKCKEGHVDGYVYEAPPTAEEAYLKCRHLILNTVRGFVRKHRIDPEEALGIADEAFMYAYLNYDPTKGLFGSRVCYIVWATLYDYMRTDINYRKRYKTRPPHTLDLLQRREHSNTTETDTKLDFEDLSANAKQVIDVARTIQPRGPKRGIRTLIRELTSHGWSGVKITEAFREIKQNLGTL